MKKYMTSMQPACDWTDGFPSGNGMLGVTVYGSIKLDTLLFNHKDLWENSKKPVLSECHHSLDECRRLIAEGRNSEAEELLRSSVRNATEGNCKTPPFRPCFDLKINTDIKKPFSEYRRVLDFETGVVSVKWSEDGVGFARDTFVSRADNIAVTRISAAANQNVTFNTEACGVEPQSAMWAASEEASKLPFEYEAYSLNERYLVFKAKHPDGYEYGGVSKIIGDACCEGKYVRAWGGEITVLTGIYINEPGEEGVKRLIDRLDSMDVGYEALLKRHTDIHGSLYNSSDVSFSHGEAYEMCNERLLSDAYDGGDCSALIQKLYDYGRYLLISSSPAKGWPANLQGVWNGDYSPMWNSDYHNDINIQMNYWQSMPGGMPELMESFFCYYEQMIDDFRTNAKQIFNCRGILLPIAQSTHGIVYPALWAAWTGGGAWIAQHFYDYFLYTLDEEFLAKRAVPFMAEVALFYRDFMTLDPDGKYRFSPSLSPENRPAGFSSMVVANSTMDAAQAREVMTNLISAYKRLGIKKDECAELEEMLTKLPDYRINSDGALTEWIDENTPDSYSHRHYCHIYPFFPGLEIYEGKKGSDRLEDAVLFNAVKTAIEKRKSAGLGDQAGWSFVYVACMEARLGNEGEALNLLELMCRSCVGANLWTYHNDWRSQGLTMSLGEGVPSPFQIDANLGLCASILEMLMFSDIGIIKLLPALPKEWQKGSFKDLRCRGNITVSLEWEGESVCGEIKSAARGEVTLILPKGACEFVCAECTGADSEGAYELCLPKNTPVKFEFRRL